jgi:hypothetical protein
MHCRYGYKVEIIFALNKDKVRAAEISYSLPLSDTSK